MSAHKKTMFYRRVKCERLRFGEIPESNLMPLSVDSSLVCFHITIGCRFMFASSHSFARRQPRRWFYEVLILMHHFPSAKMK